jgi:flagellar basal-body rod modification protein FlgD
MQLNGPESVNTYTANPNKPKESQNTLGQDAFLRILVTQMKNQNPLEPQKDTEFIGQMAQFSSLEQLTNLNKTMNQFVGLQGKQHPLTEQAHLLGNKVHWQQTIDGEVQTGEGIVKAIFILDGELTAELDSGDIKIPLSFIQRIEKQ